MNRKQFIVVLLALAIVGRAGLVLIKHDRETWVAHEARVGDKVFPDFAVNKITSIHIKGGTEFNILRTNGIWRVAERDGYPANFAMISDFLLKMREAKVMQSEVIGQSQLQRLGLTSPGVSASGATLFEFKDQAGVELGAVFMGKKHDKPQDPSEPLGLHGFFDGRYVLLPPDTNNVLLVSDELAAAVPQPENWLARNFFKIENIKLISFISPNPGCSWELSRENPSSPWILANAGSEEVLDTNICNDPGEILAFPSFDDVMPKTPENLTREGLENPIVVTAVTDDAAYTLKFGKRHSNGTYPMAVAVAGSKPTKAQELSSWIFVVGNWANMVIHNRSDLLVKKPIGSEQAAAR